MTAQLKPMARYRQLIATSAPQLPGQGVEWLNAQRAAALQDFNTRGFPTRRDEAWRYTALEPVLEPNYNALPSTVPASSDLLAKRPLEPHAGARLVFVNGRWAPQLSHYRNLPEAVWITSLRDALETQASRLAPWLGRTLAQAQREAKSGFTALNTALLEDGCVIHIPAQTKLTAPIEIIYLTHGLHAEQAAALHLRNLILLETGASATIIEQYAASVEQTHCAAHSGLHFTNSLTEIQLGNDAQLEHYRLQDEAATARHLGQVYLEQAAASRYRGLAVSLGGRWSRTEYHNRLSAAHAECQLDGFYMADDRQLTDFQLDIEHAAAQCHSRERFKGLLTGQGRAVFNGRVCVQRDAQQTVAHLSNANLMLSQAAEVDTKPQLEIYADDVQCSHGTSVGQLDPQQLFYLRSRGLTPDMARRLLCLGFVGELLDEYVCTGLRNRIEEHIQSKLTKLPENSPLH